MNRSVVIAQVGAGKYKNTKYVHGDQMKPEGTVIDDPDALGINTNYSFEAVMKEVLSHEPDQMDLILAATTKSYLGSLYDVFSVESIAQAEAHSANALQDTLPEGILRLEDLFEADKPDDNEPEKTKIVKRITEDEVKSVYEESLSENMCRHFHTDIPISVKVTIIENGENREQLQNNFSSIQDVLDDVMEKESNDWDIYFDITNGFRSFPIYIYTLINYLQKFRGSSVSKGGVMRYHMYYGMWEASKQYSTNSSQKEGEKVSVTPLVDLQVIDELLQWINAVSEFQNCGSVKQILGILKMRPDWDIQIGNNDTETLSYAFEMFDYGTNSNNLAAIERGINLLTNMEEKISSEETMNDAEKLLLKSISEDFIERFGTEESRPDKPYPYSFLLIQLADWFHKMGREGNAAIAVQETVITYLMERYTKKITEYLLGKKAIWELRDKPNFQEGCNLKEPQFLFAHELRDEIRSLLKRLEDANGRIKTFYENYKKIQDDIRNIMAHIVLTEGSENNYQTYTDKLEEQIGILLKEIKNNNTENATDDKEDAGIGNGMVELMFPKASPELWNQLWKPIEEPEEGVPIKVNYNRLIKQMNRMKEITESALNKNQGFQTFLSEKEQLELVFKGMDSWIHREEGNNVNPEKYYPKYYGEKLNKKGELQTGYERLKKTIENDYKIFNAILTF